MRAVAGLVLGDVEALLPVLGDHRLAERLGAVGVRPLADHQHRRILVERRRRVQRCHRGLEGDVPLGTVYTRDGLGDPADVLGRGATAAADQRQAVIGDEARQRLGEFVRLQRVFGALGAQHRQAGVRHHRHRCLRVLRQVAQVFAHLSGTSGAVQADHVDTERLDRRQRCTDLAAQQHGARRLDRDVCENRDVTPELRHRTARAQHRGLELQQVLAGLDEDRVGAALEHAQRRLQIGVPDHRVLGVPERRQLGARAHRSQHVALAVRGAHLVGDPAGDGGGLLRQLADLVGDVVVAEIAQVAAERVGLDRVGAGREVVAVDLLDDVGAGLVEDLVAALEVVEVVQRQIGFLQLSAHGPVAHQYPLRQGVEQVGVVGAVAGGSHINRVVGLPNRASAHKAHGTPTSLTLT